MWKAVTASGGEVTGRTSAGSLVTIYVRHDRHTEERKECVTYSLAVHLGI